MATLAFIKKGSFLTRDQCKLPSAAAISGKTISPRIRFGAEESSGNTGFTEPGSLVARSAIDV